MADPADVLRLREAVAAAVSQILASCRPQAELLPAVAALAPIANVHGGPPCYRLNSPGFLVSTTTRHRQPAPEGKLPGLNKAYLRAGTIEQIEKCDKQCGMQHATAETRETETIFSRDDWISPKEVTGLFKISVRWLIEARKGKNEGPPWYKIGGRIQYRKSEVAAWLKSRRQL